MNTKNVVPCSCTIRSGKRKGEPCGEPAKHLDTTGEPYCATHIKSSPHRVTVPGYSGLDIFDAKIPE